MMIAANKQKLLFYSAGALLTLALSACTGTEITSSSSEAAVSSQAVSSSVPVSVSSAVVSSSSAAATIGSVANGQSLMSDSLCSGCHTDNGDGTFGGLVPFNAITMNRGATAAQLATYISQSMPSTSPGLCTTSCANDTAAYLWSFS